MKLKHQTKTFFEVDGFDLTDFICNYYGCTKNHYNFGIDQEMGNGDEKSFTIKKEELDEYEQEILDNFVDTKQSEGYISHILLQDLCNKGLIEEGNYLISLYW